MTQLAPAFDGANPQDAPSSTAESVESTEQEVVTSTEEGNVEKSETEAQPETKPGFKPITKRGSPPTWERFNEVYGQMKRLDRLAMQLLDERKQKPRAERREAEVEPDWDSLTPKQFAEEMRKASRRDLEEIVSQTLTPLSEQAKVREASDSISRAAAKYPDFFDHRAAMIEIAEKHPQLDAEEVYLIASGQKGVAGDKIMTRVRDKVEQKRNALTTRRSSLTPKQQTNPSFKSVREGALAAAKELGMDIE